jgi:hypothetical protein
MEMESSNSCHRVVLAGNAGCRVLYCEECNVAEVEVGALSLRLEMAAFHSLGEMLQEAMSSLAKIDSAKSGRNNYSHIGNMH